ncbi:hypothetical protein IHQ71_29175 (plasmid) [Rhizobium sp. TH2]|uniref:hypothetical protein n=1 Tax=Rhizobium sp. TH2 TaxID=2775403 RepID=UPI0021587221|nr:hypothetical protein [Rhizobium sp. TH2]UVC12301.1 hypothetical protein IHQ71_29175 [Rhizobium sp. TH2]
MEKDPEASEIQNDIVATESAALSVMNQVRKPACLLGLPSSNKIDRPGTLLAPRSTSSNLASFDAASPVSFRTRTVVPFCSPGASATVDPASNTKLLFAGAAMAEGRLPANKIIVTRLAKQRTGEAALGHFEKRRFA